MPAKPVRPRDDAMVDAVEEVGGIAVGLGILVFALFPLSVPVIVLALVLVLPLVPVALAAALLAAPIVLVRRITRRPRELRSPG